MSSPRGCFDWASSFYDCTRAIPDELLKKTIETLLEKVDIKVYSRMLEVGVGTGRIAIPLSKKLNLNTVGIDISEKMLQKCREKITLDTNFQLIVADGHLLPFSRNQFDIFLTCHILHLLPDPFQFIKNIIPLLVQNGYYINLEAYVNYNQTLPFKIYYNKLAEAGYHHINKWESLRSELMIYLSERGWKHCQCIVEGEGEISIKSLVHFIRDRVFSHQRAITDDLHQRSLKHLYMELERKNIDLSEIVFAPATSRFSIFQRSY
ncbi:MAG: class I SAM-dependent methyltransferase [Candidatus Hodarchaeales archaeon]|jgi:ubiquinone/menaquinone biosynthesis C-methylase UbiE